MRKLFSFILSMALIAVFVVFNSGDTKRCNVWFFHEFTSVPVFITIIAAFVIGVFVALPIAFLAGKKHRGSGLLNRAKAVVADTFDDTDSRPDEDK